jgi:hypothetical protein
MNLLAELERIEAIKEVLFYADSELSAQAHGRPASNKALLVALSHRCREGYEQVLPAMIAKLRDAGEREAKLREALAMCVPYVEASIVQLENEVEYEYSHTEAQKAISAGLQDARHTLAVARNHLSANLAMWQDIASAPKDGRNFIGLCGELAFTCYLSTHNEFSPKPDGGHVVSGQYERWSRIESDAVVPCNPTHWQPLPTPPAELAALRAEVERLRAEQPKVHWVECSNCGKIVARCEGHSPCNAEMPLLRQENARLQAALTTAKAELAALREAMEATQPRVYVMGDSGPFWLVRDVPDWRREILRAGGEWVDVSVVGEPFQKFATREEAELAKGEA